MPISSSFTTTQTPIFKPATNYQDNNKTIGFEQLGARQTFSMQIIKHPYAFAISAIVLFLQFIKNHIQKADELKTFNEFTQNIIPTKTLKADEKIDSKYQTIDHFVSQEFYKIAQDDTITQKNYSISYEPDTEKYNQILKTLEEINETQTSLTATLEKYMEYIEEITAKYPKGITKTILINKIKSDLAPLFSFLDRKLKQLNLFKEPVNSQSGTKDVAEDIKNNMPELEKYYKANTELTKATWMAAAKILSFNEQNPIKGMENQIKTIEKKLDEVAEKVKLSFKGNLGKIQACESGILSETSTYKSLKETIKQEYEVLIALSKIGKIAASEVNNLIDDVNKNLHTRKENFLNELKDNQSEQTVSTSILKKAVNFFQSFISNPDDTSISNQDNEDIIKKEIGVSIDASNDEI